MDVLVDSLIDDEAERDSLLAKSFIIVGKPGVGKSTLAKKIAESWNCVLIDDTGLLNMHIENKTKEGTKLLSILSEGEIIPEDLVLQLILARLNSPDVNHYGYVLSCLPFMSEECMKIPDQIELIKNLRLTPDIIIHIKCADKDLVQRLSGLKQHPVTGQLFSKDQWTHSVFSQKENKDQDVDDDDDDEQILKAERKESSKDIIDQMVWTPENLPRNAFLKINMYKETMLRPLEDYMTKHNPLYLLELDGNNPPEELHSSVMAWLGSKAMRRVPVPVLLHHSDEEELPESIDTEELLRMMSSSRTVAPGFRWRRSRWGRICPVALKEGKIIPGKPEFSVGFLDKLYILSSQEAYQKFVTSPRRYLVPPMPRPPCKVSITGPPLAGKSTMCRLLAQHYGAVVLDVEKLLQPALAKAENERLDKIKEETTQAAIEKVKMQMQQDSEQNMDKTSDAEVTEDHAEVKAMILKVMDEAKQSSAQPPFELYVNVLGKCIKEVEEMESDSEVRTGWVLDNFPKNISEVDALQQAGILPDTVFCLRDSDGHQILKRLYEMNKENVNKAIQERLQNEKALRKKEVLEKKEKESEAQSTLETVAEETDEEEEDPAESDASSSADPDTMTQEAVELQDDLKLGYPNVPEMKEYKVQMQQFEKEWDHIESILTDNHCVLEIGSKSPENLLAEMVQQMEKPFQHVAWELSAFDLDEETEDAEALEAFERAEGGSDGHGEDQEDDRDIQAAKRLLGDTKHFCPVALKNHNVLRVCTDEFSAKYRERTFYFSSLDAQDSFLENPVQFVAQTEPLQPPALRIFLLGVRGSGKSTHGKWLALQLGLFHIQFRELLQKLVIAKTKNRIPYSDEVIEEDSSEDLEAQIQETMKGNLKEMEEKISDMKNDVEHDVAMTEEELAIKAYLSDGDPLSPQILDMVIAPFWKQEPYVSTGFILEGFPHDPDQVQYMLQRQLFPDVTVVMEVDVKDVQKHLLPTYLEKWRKLHNKRVEQLKLLRDLHRKTQEEKISKRRAELMAEEGAQDPKITTKYQVEEHEAVDKREDWIEAVLREEFPLEDDDDDDEDLEDDETEDTLIERLEMEIEERFKTDENNLATVTELLSEHNIPKLAIDASRRLHIIQYHLRRNIEPLLANRESLFQTCQPISYSLSQKLLRSSYKLHSAFGCWDPVQLYKNRDTIQPLQWPLNTSHPLLLNQYVYFFASKENLNDFMLNPLKYLRQTKPTPTLPIKIAVTGPPKSGKTTVAQMFAKKYGLARLSIGGVMRMVLDKQGHTDLAVQMRRYLTQGLVVPDELAIQCLEVALLSSVCSIQGYVLDDFPMTLSQAKLMESRSIIPMIVVELVLDTEEVLKRGLEDKMNPNKPYLMHDSSAILDTCNSSYKKEVEQVRQYFQQQHRNWFIVDGSKSKWWIWTNILREVSISMKNIQSYLERRQNGQAACINRLCITPKELDCWLAEFGHYCPVCLALQHHLVDCLENAALTRAAEFKGHYYMLCGENHLEEFLSTPDQFVPPACPHTLPQPHLMPRKLTEIQVKNKFPQEVEMKGFCPVTYMDGKQRYEALVRGKMEHAVEYRERIYIFETKEKQDMFMRTPETYWDQKLPNKVPPLPHPVPLTSLPTLGYLEQGVAEPIIKALTAVGTFKPRYPFLSAKRSAEIFVAYYLKAFNPKSTEQERKKYKRKLALFEEDCELIPYLGSVMRETYKPPSERPADFDFKLKRFLALRNQGPDVDL